MNIQPINNQDKPKQEQLKFILVVTIFLSCIMRLTATGWGLLLYGFLLIILVVAHVLIQNYAIKMVPNSKPIFTYLILLSNLLFFLGFVCQVDAWDGGSYAPILFGAEVSSSWLNILNQISIASFIALVISWIVLLVIGLEKNYHTHALLRKFWKWLING